MAKGNKFHDELDAIRMETQDHGDISRAIGEHLGGLLLATYRAPLDAGVKQIRAITVCPSKNQSAMPGGEVLLIVRATTDAGQDVVSYTSAPDVESCLLGYAFCVEQGSLVWKADDGGGKKPSAKDFLDTVKSTSR